jgi:hypothetical protein
LQPPPLSGYRCGSNWRRRSGDPAFQLGCLTDYFGIVERSILPPPRGYGSRPPERDTKMRILWFQFGYAPVTVSPRASMGAAASATTPLGHATTDQRHASIATALRLFGPRTLHAWPKP